MSELHVITTIANPLRYRSRYKLYEEFRKRFQREGARLYTIELAFEDSAFVVTESHNDQHFQVRSRHLMWYKENLINIALKRLPPGWKYVAWVDADISFVRPDWIEETLEQMKHHAFVQMFTHVIDLGPNYEPLKIDQGFSYRHSRSRIAKPTRSDGSENLYEKEDYGQTGYAWAARRDALEAVGGLIDWSILGANDYYMALALIGQVDPRSTRMPESNYARMFMEWQETCLRHIGGDIGYVDNSLLHYWHGSRADRGYDTRWKILRDHQFDPAVDLRTDTHGVLELTDAKPGLREDIRKYFLARNEDSNEA